jgi:ureidoglycolate hydrolase
VPRVVELPVELCTETSFKPFGQTLGQRAGAPNFQTPTTKTWQVDFGIDGLTELLFASFDPVPMEFTHVERHFAVTQSFFPLGDHPAITVFAAPTANDPKAIPRPEDLKALLVPGNMGIMMYRGTWHSGRFPIRNRPAEYAFLTDAHTTVELSAMIAKSRAGRLTQLVDYTKEFGCRFRIVDPKGLLKAA